MSFSEIQEGSLTEKKTKEVFKQQRPSLQKDSPRTIGTGEITKKQIQRIPLQDLSEKTIAELKPLRLELIITSKGKKLTSQTSAIDIEAYLKEIDYLIAIKEFISLKREAMQKKKPSEIVELIRYANALWPKESSKISQSLYNEITKLPPHKRMDIIHLLTKDSPATIEIFENLQNKNSLYIALTGLINTASIDIVQDNSFSEAYAIARYLRMLNIHLPQGELQSHLLKIINAHVKGISTLVNKTLTIEKKQKIFEEILMLTRIDIELTKILPITIVDEVGASDEELNTSPSLKDAHTRVSLALKAANAQSPEHTVRISELQYQRHTLSKEIGKIDRFLMRFSPHFRFCTPKRAMEAGKVLVARVERAIQAINDAETSTIEDVQLLSHEIATLDADATFKSILQTQTELRLRYETLKAEFLSNHPGLRILELSKKIDLFANSCDPNTSREIQQEIKALTEDAGFQKSLEKDQQLKSQFSQLQILFSSLDNLKKAFLTFQDQTLLFPPAENAEKLLAMQRYVHKNLFRLIDEAKKQPEIGITVGKQSSGLPYTLRCYVSTEGHGSLYASFGVIVEGGQAKVRKMFDLVRGEWEVQRRLLSTESDDKKPLTEETKMIQDLITKGVPGLIDPRDVIFLDKTGQKTKSATLSKLYPEDLHHRINRKNLTDDERKKIVKGLVATVVAIHKEGVVHFDIKPGNVLLAMDGTPRLIDFGCARTTQKDATATGTSPFAAPELFTTTEDQELLANPKLDLWSLGVLLYVLVKGKMPWIGTLPPTSDKDLTQVKKTLSSENPIENIILQLLEINPSKRMDDDALLAAAKAL
jgi:hypothetical protein